MIHTLFATAEWSQNSAQSVTIVREMRSTPPSSTQDSRAEMTPLKKLLRDSKSLLKVASGLQSRDLERLLTTGVEFSELSASELTADQLDDLSSRPLLDQLDAAQTELSSVARLARRVIGLISVPRPAQKHEDLNVGGVADITNRGTPDRLLATELAWDDMTLATRLAQNEALYYRRETPPENAESERIILTDHGLRFWGVLRIFALATHLGLQESVAKTQVTGYLSGPYAVEPLQLSTPSEVVSALGRLPAHIDPTASLQTCLVTLQQSQSTALPDFFFITSAENSASPSAQETLGEITTLIRKRGGRSYEVLLTKNGDLTFLENLGSQKRSIQKGVLDLDELLKTKKERPKPSETLTKQTLEQAVATTFYNHYPPPLQLPCVLLNRHGKHLDDSEYIRAVTLGGYLMEWKGHESYGTELSSRLPGRNFWVTYSEPRGRFLVACSASTAGGTVSVQIIEPDGTYSSLPLCASQHAFPIHAVFHEETLILAYSKSLEAISLTTGERVDTVTLEASFDLRSVLRMHREKIQVGPPPVSPSRSDGEASGRDNIVYTGVQKPDHIAFTVDGSLILAEGKRRLCLDLETLTWATPLGKALHSFPLVKTTHRRFPSEEPLSQAIIQDWIVTFDPRGFLHLSAPKISFTVTALSEQIFVWTRRNSQEPTKSALANLIRDLFKSAKGHMSS